MSPTWWAVGVAVFLYLVRPVLPPFILGAVLAYLLDPAAEGLSRRLRAPRAAAAVAVYLAFLAVVAGLAAALVPLLAAEARELARHGPEILEAVFLRLFGRPELDLFGRPVSARALGLYLVRAAEAFVGEPREALQVAAALLEGAFGAFLTLVVGFYLLLDGRRLAAGGLGLLPGGLRAEVSALAGSVHRVFGRYLRGQLFLVLFMAALTYPVLRFGFNLRYALAVALLTGLLEVIPFVGPAAAATLAAGLGLAQHGPEAAGAILLVYLALRLLEDQAVMPLVLGRAVGLHPAVALFAVLSGGALAGLLGVVLAVPVAAAVKVVIDRYRAGKT